MNLDKRESDVQKLGDYFTKLMLAGFSGRVNLRFDQGFLQPDIRIERNDKLQLVKTR